MASKNDEIRAAEDALDPVGAPARRVLSGEWSPDPREVLREAERIEREERELQWAEDAVKKDAVAARRAARLAELRSIRTKLRESAEGHTYRAASLVIGREHERLSDAEYTQFRKAVNAAATDTGLERELAQLQEREAEKVPVVAERGRYESGSPNSWVRDTLVHLDRELHGAFATRSGSDMRPQAVEERLARHATDVRRALVRRSRYGKFVEQQLREQHRHDDPDLHRTVYRKQLHEIRSGLVPGGGLTASASGGGAAAFVPPAFLIDHVWAEYRSPCRSFADQCRSDVPLPDYGLEVYLTVVTGGTTVATQTELSGVSEGDPTTSLSSSPIVTKAGQVTVSQAFLDRAGPGIAGDQVLFEQLQQQLDAQVDSYAISQALAGAQSVTTTGSFALATTTGVGGFLKDVKSAKNLLHDTAGVSLRGTHMFAIGDFVDYIGSYADAQGRPVFSPCYDDNYLPIRAGADNDAGGAEGYSGYVVNGLALFADDNIPNSGSNAQLIVCKPSTVLHMQGAPVTYCYPPTYAGGLDAVLGVRQYIATVARFPSGIAVIGGSAYAASTFS